MTVESGDRIYFDDPDWDPETAAAFDALAAQADAELGGALDAEVQNQGFEVWTPTCTSARPVADQRMFHGPIGEFAATAGEHTEADPVAVFAQALTLFGVMLNRSAYVEAGNDHHHAALFTLICGATAKGAKGTSWAVTRKYGTLIDAPLMTHRVLGGFGSGEALVADLAAQPEQTGPRDTRTLIFESEFGGLLASASRQGSTVSNVIRDGWDGRPLQNRTRGGGRLVANDYHLGAIGHITAPELRAKLAETDTVNGFMNRWLCFWVERGQLHPDGGNVPDGLIAAHAHRLRDLVAGVRGVGRVERTPEAAELWDEIYRDLAEDDPPGALGGAISRSAPQTLRLSLIFALADGAREITVDHVGAAYLVWRYCRDSTALIFGESTGSSDADRLLDALRTAGHDGIDFTGQNDLFSRHRGKAARARAQLEQGGLAATVTVPTGGKPRKITYAIRPRRIT